MAVDDADFEVAYLDYLGFMHLRVIIKVAPCHVAHALGRSQVLEPLSSLARAHVTCAQHVLHLAWEQQVLEFVGDVRGSLGDVKVTNYKCELGLR